MSEKTTELSWAEAIEAGQAAVRTKILAALDTSEPWHALTATTLDLTDEERRHLDFCINLHNQYQWRDCNDLYLGEEPNSWRAQRLMGECQEHLAAAVVIMTALYQSEGPWVESGGFEHAMVRTLWRVSEDANVS